LQLSPALVFFLAEAQAAPTVESSEWQAPAEVQGDELELQALCLAKLADLLWHDRLNHFLAHGLASSESQALEDDQSWDQQNLAKQSAASSPWQPYVLDP
jgi:hypothetical protein